MTFNKGFMWLPLLIIAGLVILGGGAYWYTHQTVDPQAPLYQQATTTPPTTQAATNAPIKNNPTPSATIDQSSLTSAAAHPTITGNAQGLSSVIVEVSQVSPDQNQHPDWSATVPVQDGKWSFTPMNSNAMIGGGDLSSAYSYQVQVVTPNSELHILTSGTLTIGSQSQVSVPGMSQYTDASFGFSFWYPSGWTITPAMTSSDSFAALSSLVGDGLSTTPSLKTLTVSNGTRSIVTAEITSQSGIHEVCGQCSDRVYFDPSLHEWMTSRWDGNHNTVTSPADVSDNTMGGLHVIWTSVVPLSAHNFLVVQDTTDNAQLSLFINTIVATDGSVATPVSTAQQVATIQAELAAYAGQ